MIHLHRHQRLVMASGPNRTPLPPTIHARIAEALTYYERRYDYTSPGDGIDIVDRKIYSPGPTPQTIIFPCGLQSRIQETLTQAKCPFVLQGRTIVESCYGQPADAIDWDGFFSQFQIYPDQQTCLTKIVAADGGVIASPTGTGKSTIMRMICRMYSKAIIHVATKSANLADEIYTDLSTVVPNVAMRGGGKKGNPQARVTVFVADSLNHGYGKADILLLDELHELLAPKYVEKLGAYKTSRIFGFSASPTGRMDGRDILGEAICGPVLHEMSYQDAVAAGRVVPIAVEWLRVPDGPDTSRYSNIVVKDRHAIWHNDIRNSIIAARVREFADDEQVMIMVRTIGHAVHLRKFLPEYTMVYAANGVEAGQMQDYIRSGLLPANEPRMTSERLTQLRREFAAGTLKKVIANYVWSTGVNFRHLAVLVRADAAGSEIRDVQIPGRVSRRIVGSKEAALLIDCWDEWDNRLLRKAQQRGRNYRKKGWSQQYRDPQTLALPTGSYV